MERRESLMYLFGSISGDIGNGGGLYPLPLVGSGMLVAVEFSVEGCSGAVDAALFEENSAVRKNPTPPPLPSPG